MTAVGALASANLVVRFLCELAALAALAVWGAQASDDPALQVLLGISAPLLVVAVWGMWVAPRASRRARDPWRAGMEVLVFGAAVAGLVDGVTPGSESRSESSRRSPAPSFACGPSRLLQSIAAVPLTRSGEARKGLEM